MDKDKNDKDNILDIDENIDENNSDKDKEKDKDKKTLDFALELASGPGTDYQSWQTRTLGLNLVLLSLAEVQANRVKLLSSSVIALEERVFSDEIVRNLPPAQLMSTYKAATESLSEATGFIKTVLTTTDWGKLEADLLVYKAHAVSKSNNLSPEFADRLIEALGLLDEKRKKNDKDKKNEDNKNESNKKEGE